MQPLKTSFNLTPAVGISRAEHIESLLKTLIQLRTAVWGATVRVRPSVLKVSASTSGVLECASSFVASRSGPTDYPVGRIGTYGTFKAFVDHTMSDAVIAVMDELEGTVYAVVDLINFNEDSPPFDRPSPMEQLAIATKSTDSYLAAAIGKRVTKVEKGDRAIKLGFEDGSSAMIISNSRIEIRMESPRFK